MQDFIVDEIVQRATICIITVIAEPPKFESQLQLFQTVSESDEFAIELPRVQSDLTFDLYLSLVFMSMTCLFILNVTSARLIWLKSQTVNMKSEVISRTKRSQMSRPIT